MPLVSVPALEAFCQRSLEAAGASAAQARTVAQVLVAADARGIYSHGSNRLEMYVREALDGVTDVHAAPRIERETAAAASVDGRNAFGAVVGVFCMELAMAKARSAGVGWVVARASNHYGIAGYYAMLAQRSGLIGVSLTNTSPLLVPTRARAPALGTNPIAVAAPSGDARPFVLDMATTTCPIGRVEVAARTGTDIPPAWGVDARGQPTRDPRAVLDGGGLLPLGGPEQTAGYKGYGLAMLVEVLCGILAGAAYGPNIRPWRQATGRHANLGQCFIAIDPAAFADGFEDRMRDLADGLRSMPPADDALPVLVPGDPEREREAHALAHGIPLHDSIMAALRRLAEQLGIAPPETMPDPTPVA